MVSVPRRDVPKLAKLALKIGPGHRNNQMHKTIPFCRKYVRVVPNPMRVGCLKNPGNPDSGP